MLDTNEHVSLSKRLKNFPAEKNSVSGIRFGSVMISTFSWATTWRSSPALLQAVGQSRRAKSRQRLLAAACNVQTVIEGLAAVSSGGGGCVVATGGVGSLVHRGVVRGGQALGVAEGPAIDDGDVAVAPVPEDLADEVAHFGADLLRVAAVRRGRPGVEVMHHAQRRSSILPAETERPARVQLHEGIVQGHQVALNNPGVLAEVLHEVAEEVPEDRVPVDDARCCVVLFGSLGVVVLCFVFVFC